MQSLRITAGDAKIRRFQRAPFRSWQNQSRTGTTPLRPRGAAAALDFYKRAFGATEILRIPGPEGTIGHAEIRIGDSPIMLADEFAEMEFLSPLSRGGTTVHIHLYVSDADATLAQAVAAGGTLKRPARDEFYGDRTGTVEDPFGHVWHIARHQEDLSPEELHRRAEVAMKKP